MASLAEHVRRERAHEAPLCARPVARPHDERFPRSHLRPIVLGAGMLAISVFVSARSSRWDLTGGDLLRVMPILAAGWVPLVLIRRQVAFRVVAILLALVGLVLGFLGWWWVGWVIPAPALAAAVFDAPPRRPPWRTARVITVAVVVFTAVPAVTSILLPASRPTVSVCFIEEQYAAQDQLAFGDPVGTGFQLLPGIRSFSEDRATFYTDTSDAAVERVIAHALAQPNVASAHRGSFVCPE